MQVTKGTWRMREQCVPGSLSSSPAQERGNEAKCQHAVFSHTLPIVWVWSINRGLVKIAIIGIALCIPNQEALNLLHNQNPAYGISFH